MEERTPITPRDDRHPDDEFRALYTFTVEEEFKGSGLGTYTVIGDAPAPPPAADGTIVVVEDAWPLDVGKRYLIFAFEAAPMSGVSRPQIGCGSVAAEDGSEAIRDLRELRDKRSAKP